MVISIELHTEDDFLCFLDFLLALCFEPHDFELFGKKIEGKIIEIGRERKDIDDRWMMGQAEKGSGETQKQGSKRLMI